MRVFTQDGRVSAIMDPDTAALIATALDRASTIYENATLSKRLSVLAGDFYSASCNEDVRTTLAAHEEISLTLAGRMDLLGDCVRNVRGPDGRLWECHSRMAVRWPSRSA